jgi:hypothetical protein
MQSNPEHQQDDADFRELVGDALVGDEARGEWADRDAWLAPEEYGEDPEAAITFSEFRTLAWEVANEAARQLGWIRTCDELHEAAKAASAI